MFAISKRLCGLAIIAAALGSASRASADNDWSGIIPATSVNTIESLTPVAEPSMLATEGKENWNDFGDNWRYRSYMSLWMSGMDGKVGKGDYEANVDLSFSDLFDKMNLGLGLNFEVGKGPWSLIVWGQYNHFEADMTTPRGFDGDAKSTFAFADVSLAYLLLDTPCGSGSRFYVEALAGIRWTYLDATVEINEGPLAGRESSRDKNWFDPYVGVRLRYDFTEQFNISVMGTIGGFGVGSDLAWSVNALAEYRFNPTWSFIIGYRALSYDYEDGGFKFDVTLSGPVLGISIRR